MLCNYCERGGRAERRDCEGWANVLSVHNCVGYVVVAKFFLFVQWKSILWLL
nr:MAG TPA: hypothetical protein [Caudoviricetes sp.]